MPDNFVGGLYFKACQHKGLSSGTVQKKMEAIGHTGLYCDMFRSWTSGGFGKRQLEVQTFPMLHPKQTLIIILLTVPS